LCSQRIKIVFVVLFSSLLDEKKVESKCKML